MKKVRIAGDDFVYDCESPRCSTPGEPHRVPVNEVLGALDATVREFTYHHDPRTEHVALAIQYLWQTLYPAGADGGRALYGAEAPWASEAEAMVERLNDHYDPHGEEDLLLEAQGRQPAKKYLN